MAKLNMSINDIESIQNKLDQNIREISGAPMSYFIDNSGWYPNVSIAVDIAHPIGSIICMSTNENPGTRVGGTWELVDKGLKSRWHNFKTEGGWSATNATVGDSSGARIGDHGLDIRLWLSNTITLSDATIQLGQVIPTALGLTRLPHDWKYVPFSYDGGGVKDVVGTTCLTADGVITVEDIWTATADGASHGYAANSNLSLQYYYSYVPMEYMLDEACDKFYFKRIA
jgi:hypothetical protein